MATDCQMTNQESQAPEDLEGLLDFLEEAGKEVDADSISVETMLNAVGTRSFGAMLLVPGLLTFSPLSGIVGLPTLCGLLVLLIAGQLLARRKHFWLPRWLLKRSLPRKRFLKALRFLRPGARWIDKLIKHRLTMLTHGAAAWVVAVICIFIALSMPVLELVPFANSLSGAALAAIGLGLIAQDGLLVALTVGLYLIGLGAIIYQFM